MQCRTLCGVSLSLFLSLTLCSLTPLIVSYCYILYCIWYNWCFFLLWSPVPVIPLSTFLWFCLDSLTTFGSFFSFWKHLQPSINKRWNNVTNFTQLLDSWSNLSSGQKSFSAQCIKPFSPPKQSYIQCLFDIFSPFFFFTNSFKCNQNQGGSKMNCSCM